MKRQLLTVLLCLGISTAWAQLNLVNSFGSNPGNLSMYTYTPSGIGSNAGVVLVLHGCTQSASSYASESDWNSLADDYGFYVVYAQQKSANNSSECFNWFENGDINRGQGEALSMANMMQYMKNQYSVDSDKVFVTGFSGGGAMAAVMLATYPDVFRGGAIMAGLPYKAATSMVSAFSAMSPGVDKTPSQWGSLVRNAYSSYSGPYPRVAIFHGTSDYTVNNKNAEELVDQWTNVLGVDQTAEADNSAFNGNSSVRRRVYENGSGTPQVIRYDFQGMGHAIAIDPGSGTEQGGNTGSYTADVNFFSSYWAAEFFGLTGSSGGGSGGGGGTGTVAAPSNLSASATSSSSIALSWTDNANNETNMLVQRANSSGGTYSTIATLGANSTSYTNSGLSASTTYWYRVVATNGTDTDGVSSSTSATTDAAGGGGSGGGGQEVVIAQTSGNYTLSYVSTDDFGQSFTATVNGILTKVEPKLAFAISNSTLKIFSGNTVSGTPIYTQTGVSTASGWQPISLNTPVAVSAGQVYTFQITNSSLKYTSTNAYSGGSYWYNNINYTVFDGVFKVYLEANAARDAAPADLALPNQLQVYPNPAKGSLNLSVDQPVESLQLIDATGRTVLNREMGLTQGSAQIDVSTVPAGVYLLQVALPHQVVTRRIVIE